MLQPAPKKAARIRFYPFIPVEAIPSTKYFCIVRNIRNMGIRDKAAMANMAPQSDPAVEAMAMTFPYGSPDLSGRFFRHLP